MGDVHRQEDHFKCAEGLIRAEAKRVPSSSKRPGASAHCGDGGGAEAKTDLESVGKISRTGIQSLASSSCLREMCMHVRVQIQ